MGTVVLLLIKATYSKFFEDYNVVPTHNASDLIKCDQMPYINHKGKFLEDYNIFPTNMVMRSDALWVGTTL
jgi:hypothetical protein